MKLRRRLALVMAMAMLAVAAGAVAASADVERYQSADYELTVTSVNGISDYGHHFVIHYDATDDSYTGSGTYSLGTKTESLSNFDTTGEPLSFQSDYDMPPATTPYTWFPSFTLNEDMSMTFVDGYGADNVTAAEGTYTMTETSSYKNHGQYVKQADDKQAAAHSLMGMPIQSQKKNK